MKSGITEGLPYSLSRWTDVPGDPAKWSWFMDRVRDGKMLAFDPRNGIPYQWSLKPEETLGLVFWTKNPTTLIRNPSLIKEYRYKIHVTVTGWEEVEKNAPDLSRGANLLAATADVFGPEHVTWRFSPVPLVSDVVDRFKRIARLAYTSGIDRVYLSFLQTNDLMPETRTEQERLDLLRKMGDVAGAFGIKVLLCNEDRILAGHPELHPNLGSGICAPPEDFSMVGRVTSPSEGCGCVLMVDAFTVNESCSVGCKYCYAADKDYAPKKINTTRSLPILP